MKHSRNLARRSPGGRCVGGGAVRAGVPRGAEGEARLRRPEAEALGQDLREHQQDARTDRPSEAVLVQVAVSRNLAFFTRFNSDY